jgi:hypothetical protein
MSFAFPLLLCLAAPPPVSTCARAPLAELPKKIAHLGRSERTNLVSKVLATACDGKLPKPVIDALDSLHATELSEHGPAMLKALREVPEFARAGCEKWEDEFAAHTAPGEKLRSIFSQCEFEKPNLATEDELVEVADLGAVYVAMPLYKWLLMHGEDATSGRRLVRGLLGLVGDPKKPKPEPKAKGPKKKP